MKKLTLLIIALLITATAQAGTISWNSANFASLTDGWLVALYEDVSGDGFDATTINYSTGATDSDDVYLGLTYTTAISSGKSGTGWGTSFSAPGGDLALGDSIITVIFNSAALDGSATTAWYSDGFAGTLSDNGFGQAMLPATNIDATYTVTSIAAVPEPATALLFGIGGMGAWIVRRNKRKAQEEADA